MKENRRPRNYWKNPEVIEQEAIRFIESEGILTQRRISQAGLSSLAHAIGRHYPGSFHGLRDKLGLESSQKPKRYWSAEKIEEESASFYKSHGSISAGALRDHDRDDLVAAIRDRYEGGFRQLRDYLGIKQVKKSDGYWTIEKIEQEAKNFLAEHGQLSSPALKRERQDLLGAINNNYPGGLTALKRTMGIKAPKTIMIADFGLPVDSRGRINRKEMWSLPDEVRNKSTEEAVRQASEKGVEISDRGLRKAGLKGLLSEGIRRYPGGMRALQEKVGLTINRKPDGYWKDPKAIEKEAKRIIDSGGSLTGAALAKSGSSSLVYAITNHYPGAFRALRKKLKLKIVKKPDGYWTPVNIETEAMEFFNREGLLNSSLLLRRKRYDLVNAINKRYPGGFGALREKLGLPQQENSSPLSSDEANAWLKELVGEE